MAKILSIIERAFKGTIEEQDDTALWVNAAITAKNPDVTVLLRGNAVNYAVKGQDASGLAFGARRQTQPPRLEEDLAKLLTKGVKVFIVEDDLADRGVDRAELIGGVEALRRDGLPKLLAGYDQVWHW